MAGEEKRCIEVGFIFNVCVNDCILLKVGRETITGKVTRLSPIFIVLNDRVAIKISKISYIIKGVKCDA